MGWARAAQGGDGVGGRWSLWFGVAVLGSLLGGASGAWGDVVAGLVRDHAGNALKGVQVRVLEDRESKGVRTDIQGRFSLKTDAGDGVTLQVKPGSLPPVRIPGIVPGDGEEKGRVEVEYLTVRAGEPFVVRMASNPSTGYRWALAASGDARIVVPVENVYVSPRNGAHAAMGRGGVEYWIFDTRGPGSTLVQLAYVRSWEKGVPPAVVRAVAVTVAP